MQYEGNWECNLSTAEQLVARVLAGSGVHDVNPTVSPSQKESVIRLLGAMGDQQQVDAVFESDPVVAAEQAVGAADMHDAAFILRDGEIPPAVLACSIRKAAGYCIFNCGQNK